MKEMKASMDVIRKTAGEMIDQLTEELEIILEEKQKAELHEKYGILVDALEEFMNMAMVKEDGITIDAANYKCVYSGRLHENEKLDDLYAIFNDNSPADYKAHSMSVSDVIITNHGGDMQAYYVDRFGYEELPDLLQQREKYSILSRK